MSLAKDILMEKFDLCQQLQRECFDFFSVEDLEKLCKMVAERRKLANSYRFAQANKKTGKAMAQLADQLVENEHAIAGVVEDTSWM